MRVDLSQLEFIDKDLRNIIIETEKELGVEFTATSLFRISDPGVHGQLPLRGIDLRCRSAKFGEVVEDHINSKWSYDQKRPEFKCAKYHTVKGNAPHMHIQVHPNTARIKA